MKPIPAFALAAIVLFTTSCGLSDKEKLAIQQAQQVHDDSVRTAQITEVKTADADRAAQQAALVAKRATLEARRTALTDSLSSYNTHLNQEQTAMVQLRTAIYTANDEMTQIKAFHFGRLPKDRDAQVQAQELKIQTLLLNQSKLQAATAETLRAITATKTALAESN